MEIAIIPCEYAQYVIGTTWFKCDHCIIQQMILCIAKLALI